jgi:hypothetical protein
VKSIYVSSTYKDLTDYRDAVFRAIRKVRRYNIVGMEDYGAKDQCTVARCQEDVAVCDMYVGIFAWRYGFIPEDDNPERKSITELEYCKARSEGKTCLIFLLDESVPWPPHLMDFYTGENEAGNRIKEFRTELAKRSPGLFKSPDDLAAQILASVYQDESTKRVEKIALFNEISRFAVGTSGLENIQQKILDAKKAEVAEINLGVGELWWSTRLHLVVALATDYTRIQQLAFVDQNKRLVGMFSPSCVRRALALRFPEIEMAYLRSVQNLNGPMADPRWEVAYVVDNFREQVDQLSVGRGEESIQSWVDEANLEHWMARAPRADTIESPGQITPLLHHQIVSCRSAYVALVENGRLVQVTDRMAMATNIAITVLEESLK